jgi:hypothetical protein
MTILYNRPSNQARNSPLPYHPVADIFEPLKGEEFDALVKDIKANGLNEPITVHEGQILDGRNRERACVVAGVKPHYRTYQGDDPAGFVVSANIHRRHLTGKQKRELIAKLLKTKPEKPDLQIAKEIGASSHTVGKVRSKMEASGDVCKVQTRTDTRGRKQPAKKPRSTAAKLTDAPNGGNGTASLVHPRKLPSAAEVKAIVDRAERRQPKPKPESAAALRHKTRRFGATLTQIRMSCASTSSMVLPDLRQEDVLGAIASLSTSIALITTLVRRLAGDEIEPEVEDEDEDEIGAGAALHRAEAKLRLAATALHRIETEVESRTGSSEPPSTPGDLVDPVAIKH